MASTSRTHQTKPMASSAFHQGHSITSEKSYMEDIELGMPERLRYGGGYNAGGQETQGWRPWLPVILYALTTAMFLVAIGWFRDELFAALDALSTWLKEPENHGELVLFCLIFITTIPPIPLYSTLILLSGYTFGTINGFIISYISALSGALILFTLSRAPALGLLPHIQRFLRASPSCFRAIKAIERNPRLLLAVRVAPYPYNVMNVLLAGAEGMSLSVYGSITALSLVKLVIHTFVGASLRNFSSQASGGEQEEENMVGKVWTVVGLALCAGIFFYLAWVVRKKVDGELDTEDAGNDEERAAFLNQVDGEEMVEVQFGR